MLIGKIVQKIGQYHNSAFTSMKSTTVLLTKLYSCVLMRTTAITPWKSLIILHLLHNHWKQMLLSWNFAISYHLRFKKKKQQKKNKCCTPVREKLFSQNTSLHVHPSWCIYKNIFIFIVVYYLMICMLACI